MQKIHHITPNPLSFNIIDNITDNNYKLQLSAQSRELIIKCRNYLDTKIETISEPIYGITTGFGSLCNKTISADSLSTLQQNLVMSHACGTGDQINPNIVKLMMLLKIHALSYGMSGVQIQTVERIIDMYNNNIVPVVYEQGSLGASGDLVPLAHMFLPLIGMGRVYYKNKIIDADIVLKTMGWQPIKLKSKEGLALLNGTQFMSAHAVYSIIKSLKLLNYADIIGSVSLEAFDGRPEPFDPRLHRIRPHHGQIESAKNILKFTAGSHIMAQQKKHVQDPYSFRCMPQVHGASRGAIKHVASVVETEINSVTDNPTIFPDDDVILSGGNFHGQPLALALDYLAIAMAEIGNISERRTAQLILGLRGLPEFLVANPGLNSGFMIPQYAAAAIVSQNKQLCSPASVDSIVSSNGQEDHVSMGANAATKAIKVCNNTQRVLAIELLNAAQALDLRKPLMPSPFIVNFIASFRKNVEFVNQDKILYPLIDKAVEFLEHNKPENF